MFSITASAYAAGTPATASRGSTTSKPALTASITRFVMATFTDSPTGITVRAPTLRSTAARPESYIGPRPW